MTIAVRFLALLALAVTLRATEPVLTVAGPEQTLTLTAAEFAALPHADCTVADPHSGKPRHFSGVAVRELLARTGAPLGEKFRGSALQFAVLAHAGDGYGVVYALAEFDDAFSSRTIMLADQENGRPLPASSAPFQLVVPGDKRAARWARMVTRIEVVRVGARVAQPAEKP